MSLFDGISNVLSNTIQSTLNAVPGGQILSQLANNFMDSMLGQSGSSGNQAADNILNSNWMQGINSAIQNFRS